MTQKQPDIRFVFFGTSHFSVYVLDELERAGLLPTLIVTSPDKPQGRGMEIATPPAKEWANERGIDVLQPEQLDDSFTAELRNTEWDVFIVAAYGKILPKALLDVPKHGVLNVHPSLLPRWRGPSPIQAAILNDDETGVTIMLVDEKIDHGPIVAQARIEVENWPPRARVLSEMLAREGGKLLAEALPLWIRGEITPEEQKHEQATFCTKPTKGDGLIDLHDDPKQNFRKIQAYDYWPGTYFITLKDDKNVRVKIADAALEGDELVIKKVIPEGKREMSYDVFLRGNS